MTSTWCGRAALFPVEVITQMLGVPPELRQQVRLLLDKTLEREYGKIEMPEAGWRPPSKPA